MITARIIHPGFDVADGEDVGLEYSGQNLEVRFTDWREEAVSFSCLETLAFRWQEAEYEIADGERFDSIHEIENSPWLQQHIEQSMTWGDEPFHHYRMNFNAPDVLEVICRELEIRKTDEGAREGR